MIGYLSDIVINMSQNILKNQFPTVNGLQSTLLGQTLKFIPIVLKTEKLIVHE